MIILIRVTTDEKLNYCDLKFIRKINKTKKGIRKDAGMVTIAVDTIQPIYITLIFGYHLMPLARPLRRPNSC